MQAALVAVLAVTATLFWSAPATADTASIELLHENQAWYWSSNREIRQCVGTEDQGLCQVADGSGASPVEPGHLAVALQLGESNMRTYIRPDLGVVEFGSTINSLILTLPVSRADATDTEHTQHHTGPGAKAPATSDEAKASISACAVAIPWGNAEAAPPHAMDKKDPSKSIAVEPFVRTGGVDCNVFKVAGKTGAKAWTFDVTALAKKWASNEYENNGIVLLPNQTSSTDSWRVEFHGAAVTVANNELEQIYVSAKEAGSARVSFTPPVEPPPPPPPPTIDPGDGGTFTPPVSGLPVDQTPVDPTPPIAPPPAIDQPPAEPVAVPQPVTPWYAWLAMVVGIGGFVAFSRAVGREAGTAGMNRVAVMLRTRQTGVTGE